MRGRRRGTTEQDRFERSDWWGVVVDSPDPKALARFYAGLLGWELWKPDEMDPGEAAIDSGEGVTGITFHLKEDYVRPVWPNTPGEQQMMMHLDFEGLGPGRGDGVRPGARRGAGRLPAAG